MPLKLLFLFMLYLTTASAQSHGDVRLKQKNITDSAFTAGRVEIFLNGEWGTICEDYFDVIDANVICRQLGYNGSIAYPVSGFHSRYGKGDSDQPIWLDDVGCTDPQVQHILSCPIPGIGVHNCDHFSDIAVTCSPHRIPSPRTSIRLQGHTYPSQGRLEVFCNSSWFPVCSDENIDASEGDLICKELGYTMASSLNRTDTYRFNSVLLDDVLDCAVAENCMCPTITPCSGELFIECAHNIPFGAVRLTHSSEFEGILEIFINGAWRMLCVDSFTNYDANTICNKLGFFRAATFSTGEIEDEQLAPIWNKQESCNLNTDQLFNCLATESSLTCSQAPLFLTCTNRPVPTSTDTGSMDRLPHSLQVLVSICLGGGALVCFLCLFALVCCTHLFCNFHVKSKQQRRPLLDKHPNTFTFTDIESKLDREYELEKQNASKINIPPTPRLVPCSTPQIPGSVVSTLERRPPCNSPYPFPQEIERIKLQCSQETLLKENPSLISLQELMDLEQLTEQLELSEAPIAKVDQESNEPSSLETVSEEGETYQGLPDKSSQETLLKEDLKEDTA